MNDITKRLRGSDFRRAIHAMAELRHLDPAMAATLIPSIDDPDEQRGFQLTVARLIAEAGVPRLAEQWGGLASAEWREQFVSEIGQQLPRWVEAGTVDLLIAALKDSHDAVARRAVSPLVFCLSRKPERERRETAKTLSGKAALEAADRMAALITPEHRARIAEIVTAALERCACNLKDLTWPDDYIELLGLTARPEDQHAITLLEGFRPGAGETRRSEFERLDPDNLPWPTSELAQRKGVSPGTPFVRVHSIPTSLLDGNILEEAIERIRRRD